MPYICDAIPIAAPSERVRARLADVQRLSTWWPTFAVEPLAAPVGPEPAASARYTFTLMGIRIKGEMACVEASSSYVALRALTGIDLLIECYLEPGPDDGVLATLCLDYALPGAMLGQVLHRKALEEHVERDLAAAAQRLQALCEAP
jgi:hypothetical protein